MRIKTDLSRLSDEIRHNNIGEVELQVTDFKSQSDMITGELCCSDVHADYDTEILKNDAIASAIGACINKVVGNDETEESSLLTDGECVAKEEKEHNGVAARLECITPPGNAQSFATLGSWLWTRDKNVSEQENLSNKDPDTTSN
jgi:hypothetical protein